MHLHDAPVIRVFSFFEYLTFSEILRLHIEYNRHTTQRTNKSQHGALRREGEFTPRSKRDAEVHARHEDSHRSDCAIVQRSGSRTGELACDRPPSRRPVSSGASTTQRPQSLLALEAPLARSKRSTAAAAGAGTAAAAAASAPRAYRGVRRAQRWRAEPGAPTGSTRGYAASRAARRASAPGQTV